MLTKKLRCLLGKKRMIWEDLLQKVINLEHKKERKRRKKWLIMRNLQMKGTHQIILLLITFVNKLMIFKTGFKFKRKMQKRNEMIGNFRRSNYQIIFQILEKMNIFFESICWLLKFKLPLSIILKFFPMESNRKYNKSLTFESFSGLSFNQKLIFFYFFSFAKNIIIL